MLRRARTHRSVRRTPPVIGQRRASNTGVIVVAGQILALGRPTLTLSSLLTVHIAEYTITVDLDDGGRRTFRRIAT